MTCAPATIVCSRGWMLSVTNAHLRAFDHCPGRPPAERAEGGRGWAGCSRISVARPRSLSHARDGSQVGVGSLGLGTSPASVEGRTPRSGTGSSATSCRGAGAELAIDTHGQGIPPSDQGSLGAPRPAVRSDFSRRRQSGCAAGQSAIIFRFRVTSMIGEACILTYCLLKVGLPGLEPGTHGLKVRCSTHLPTSLDSAYEQ